MEILKVLDDENLHYELYHHPAVYTVEQAKIHTSSIEGVHCKNLFLRNRSGKKHYLIVMEQDSVLNLKYLSDQIGTGNLSFASKERLMKYLNVEPGSVSPLGLYYDCDRDVQVYLEGCVYHSEYTVFHPNINTQSLKIKTQDLINFLEKLGYNIEII